MEYSISFPGGAVKYIFDASFGQLSELAGDDCIIITDNHIAGLYSNLLSAYKTIVIPQGEEQKSWQMIESIATELYTHEAHRKTTLVGMGGGVITDITGFIATVYMRGVRFGFVPSTLLAMVDASIGGKNGVNLGNQKNFLGTIQQPEFILYDTQLLKTLPEKEWNNGFAEIIKYACLFDPAMYNKLQQNTVDHYRQNTAALNNIIQNCATWKNKVVLEDEKETGLRKLLNFGHTAGHAFETLYQLPHGHAVGLGMLVACMVSEKETGLDASVRPGLIQLLQQYKLPVALDYNTEDVMQVLKMDKKRNGESIDYIVLNNIGEAEIKKLSFDSIQQALVSFAHAGHH